MKKKIKGRIAKIEFETTPRSLMLFIGGSILLLLIVQPLMDTDWNFLSEEKKDIPQMPIYAILYLTIFMTIYKLIQTIVVALIFFWLGRRYERRHGRKNRA